MQVIRDSPQQRKIREFLGLFSLSLLHLPGCVDVLQPLNELIAWSDSATTVFASIKEALANGPTSIIANASDMPITAVLQQLIRDDWCTFAYFSNKQ